VARLSIVTMRSASPSLWVRRITDFVAVGGHLDYPTPGDNGAVTEPSFTIPLWADLLGVGLGGVQGATVRLRLPSDSAASTCSASHHRHHDGHGRRPHPDILLGQPPATLQSNWYLLTAGGAALVGMLLAGHLPAPERGVVGLDAVVIGMFGAARARRSPSAFPGARGVHRRLRGGRRRRAARRAHGPAGVDHARRIALRGRGRRGLRLHRGRARLGMGIVPAAIIGIVVTAVIRVLAVVFDSRSRAARLYRRRSPSRPGDPDHPPRASRPVLGRFCRHGGAVAVTRAVAPRRVLRAG
jgi:hypothetical protein